MSTDLSVSAGGIRDLDAVGDELDGGADGEGAGAELGGLGLVRPRAFQSMPGSGRPSSTSRIVGSARAMSATFARPPGAGVRVERRKSAPGSACRSAGPRGRLGHLDHDAGDVRGLVADLVHDDAGAARAASSRRTRTGSMPTVSSVTSFEPRWPSPDAGIDGGDAPACRAAAARPARTSVSFSWSERLPRAVTWTRP